MSQEVFSALQEPFPPEQVAWRVQRSGKSDRGVWLLVVPYLHARTIQERLDDVLGPAGWQVKYLDGGAERLICALGIRISDGRDDGWLWKEDGTGHMESRDGFGPADAGKGDFTNAFKRTAASGFGIGRYLGYLSEGWAEVAEDGGRFRSKVKDVGYVEWDPPELPEWALPGGAGRPEQITGVDQETGEIPGGTEAGDTDLSDRLRTLRNQAIRAGVLNDAAAERVDGVLESGDADEMRGQVKWLEKKLEREGAS